MKTICTIIAAFFLSINLFSQDTMYVNLNNGTTSKFVVDEIDSITFKEPSLRDYDGNIYKTITVGNQEWMAENLKATHYADGSPIPHVTGDATWAALPDNNEDTVRAYCWYNDDEATYKNLYGALYTYAAATNGDNSGSEVQGVCPTGWHLPSDAEWTALTDALGGASVAGGILKATSGWNDDGNGTDDIGFAALPGGLRSSYGGSFGHAGRYGYWWSSTEYNASYAWYRYMYYDIAEVYRYGSSKSYGFSVRCVRD
jgi:uncharacterized protein (TIGR02145 family)